MGNYLLILIKSFFGSLGIPLWRMPINLVELISPKYLDYINPKKTKIFLQFSTSFILTIIVLLVSNSPIKAQTYKTAVGLRVGVPLSASYKRMFDDNKALEGYIGTLGKKDYRWICLSGAYLVHQPIDLGGLEELYYYYGGGASIYFWSYEFEGNNQSTTPGIQGYLGAEYLLPNHPFVVSLEWMPSVFISGHIEGFRARYFSVGIKYLLEMKE